MRTIAAQPCDCCGSTDWQPRFMQNGFTLGACPHCGLHSIRPMPAPEVRRAEIEDSVYAGGAQRVADAATHLAGERARRASFARVLDFIGASPPPGPWLDLGCGAGTLLAMLRDRGIAAEGIELSPGRRALAIRESGCVVHAEPLEELSLPAAHYAAIVAIDVFSHLQSPASMFAAAARVLRPGGVLYLRTGEVVGTAALHHVHGWNLGEHLRWLGPETISHYAARHAFTIARRARRSMVEVKSDAEVLAAPGTSALRNAAKRTVLHVPGLLPLYRAAIRRRFGDSSTFYGEFLLRRD